MFALRIILLIFCTIIACWTTKKIVESILNLRSLHLGKKYPYAQPRTSSVVYNTKTGKLEADSQQILPFE